MGKKLCRGYLRWVSYVALMTSLLLFLSDNVDCLMIDPQNVQAIAIYKLPSNLVIDIQPNEIVFNVNDSHTINSLITSISFSLERDCSEMGALADAVVFFKFTDNTIAAYTLFGAWSHFSKGGLRGSCYFVSEEGRILFRNNAQ